MKRNIRTTLSTTAALFLAFGGPVLSAAAAGLAVDLVDAPTRTVSVPLGSGEVDRDTFFRLLDPEGNTLAIIRPEEVFGGRFWSGPLPAEVFERVGPGTAVEAATLSPEDADRARAAMDLEVSRLWEEVRLARIQRLKRAVAKLDDQAAVLRKEEAEARAKVKEARSAASRKRLDQEERINRIDRDLDRAEDNRQRLDRDRDDLADERRSLRDRPDPPQDEIAEVNEKIMALDRRIDRLDDEISDLRDDRRDAGRGYRAARDEVETARTAMYRISFLLDSVEEERRGLTRQLGELERGTPAP